MSYNWKKSFILVYILGVGLFSLFFSFNHKVFFLSLILSIFIHLFWLLSRKVTQEIIEFEINSSNKNPRLGLPHYQDEIESFFVSMRYSCQKISNHIKVFTPRYRNYFSSEDIQVETTAYSITIKAPKGILKILLSQLDLEKIFP